MSEELNKKPLPEAESKNGGPWHGGGCMLLWGKFDTACEIIGKIIVGILTLGIAPLVVHICRKKKETK